MIGSSGIEAAFEDELRGRRGIQHSNLETGEVKRQDQMPGNDVQLTIDITLQAHLQALLDPRLGLTRVHQFHAGWRNGVPISKGQPLGTPLDGSIVVLEVESGEILAMVSSPTFAEGGAMDRAARTTHEPFVHRAAEATYPPGSIVKPLVYVSAVSAGAIPIDKEVECVGHLLPGKTDSLRCWIYKMYNGTHGLLGTSEAIKNSCNIYFYTLGQVMGLDRLTSWYRKWGLDEYLDTGLRYEREVRVDGDGEEVQWRVRTKGESTGFVPHYADIASQRRSGESIMLGIGQGLVTWTPLQAANAYATLARGGRIRDASLLREEALRSGRRAGTMRLDPEACLRALDGLHRVVNDRDGTGYSIRYADSRDQTFVIPGARVWGKTGTASAPPLRIDVDGDGVFSREGPDQRIKGLDHAWFVGLAGDALEQRPRYAIAVLVEYGGSGGRVAGPIAAEVIRVLTVHGYLGGGSS